MQTIDSTIKTLYSVLSGDKGEPRDWELLKFLFHPEAKLIRYAPNKEGIWEARYMTPQEYINTSGRWIQKVGFRENELHKKIDSFGSLAHVLSTYESYLPTEIIKGIQYDSEIPFMRGFNSFQLLHDGKRWWIINNYWTRETPNNPIPEEYLSK